MILGVLAVFFAYLARWQARATGLKISFLLIFLFLALRYEYGNDYGGYLDRFIEITGYSKIFLTGERWEPGWRFLILIFKPFGFFAMTAVLALFNCVVYYRFIKKYVPPYYYWLAVFLYVFNPYLMLVHSSAMRQSVAISLFLVSIDFLVRKRPIGYFICIALALSVHKSGLVLFPVFLLAFVNWRLNKVTAVGIILFFVSLFVFAEKLYPFFNQFAAAYFPRYAEEYQSLEGTQLNTGLGLIFMVFQLIAILYYAGHEFSPNIGPWETDQDMDYSQPQEQLDVLPIDESAALFQVRARRMLYLLAIMTFMFIPLGFLVSMVSRINMYFLPIMIAVFPIILFTAKDKFFKIAFISSLIAFTLFRFVLFFLNPIWRDAFSTYQTIFSAPQIY